MLTAAEAAARLGVKRATLYAYVSRGLLHRQVALDGRTSLFDPDEIAAFRSERRPGNDGELSTVITTSLTRVADDGLWFRGRDLAELVAGDRDYETVADWLWTGVETTTPVSERWPSPVDAITAARTAQLALPSTATYVDRLRVNVTVASATDPLRHDLDAHAVQQAGRRLLAVMVDGLPDVGVAPTDGRLADRLWAKFSANNGTQAKRAALNVALASLVDHGLAGSTLAARVAASVRADPYSVVQAGLGVADGALHGAASAPVHELLTVAETTGGAAEAVGEARKRLGHTPGFGHMVYREQDPRYGVVLGQVIDAWSRDGRVAVVQQVRDVVRQRSDALPNIDFALGALTYLAKMPPTAGEAIFVTGRTAGWLAHAIEEFEETPLRFRPKARYVGERVGGRAGS